MMGPRTSCTHHCCACQGHFTSLAAFDAHRVGPPDDRRCDVDVEDREGRALLVPKTENGTCLLQRPGQVGVVVWAGRDWWKAAQTFGRAA